MVGIRHFEMVVTEIETEFSRFPAVNHFLPMAERVNYYYSSVFKINIFGSGALFGLRVNW